jgi:GTP-binding protein Era
MKAGFVTFVGRPNVGKSTLLNMLVGQKVAIMSPRAQTTRTVIQGINTTEEGQIIFVDTPGIHKPQDALGKFMNEMALIGADGVDIVCVLFPVDDTLGKGDQYILDMLQGVAKDIPVFAIITKIDKLPKERILEKTKALAAAYDFTEIVPVSALAHENLTHLKALLLEYLPDSPLLFEPETVSTQSAQFTVRELVREKVLHLTREEVPHAIAIVVETWEERADELELGVVIVVERNSQKGIIIGKNGAMIKAIREQAERDLKRHFQKKVLLHLWVKVEKNWRTKAKYLHAYGYDLTDYDV